MSLSSLSYADSDQRASMIWSLGQYWLFCLALALNWGLAAIMPGAWCGPVSLALFFWLLVLAFRFEARGSAIILPFMVNRLAVMVSLIVIGYEAEMPELAIQGQPGDYAASYVVYCTILLLVYCAIFKSLNPMDAGKFPRAILPDSFILGLNGIFLMLAGCIGLYAFAKGLQGGFPLLTQMDRFDFRINYADKIVLYMLNLKFVIAAVLGNMAFDPKSISFLRRGATLVFALMTIEYFLFGDKFFTILGNICFFAMPYLVLQGRNVLRIMARSLPYILAGLAMAFAATLYIYSDYGRRGGYETFQKLSERVSGQGELWYVATQVQPAVLNWDSALVAKNAEAMTLPDADLFALREGIATFYFSNLYAPADIRASIYRNAGRVSFTMGMEPLGLIMFGYIGLAGLLCVVAGLVALAASYMYRAFRSYGMPSVAFACFVLTSFLYATNQGAPWIALGLIKLKWLLLILLCEIGIILYRVAARQEAKNV